MRSVFLLTIAFAVCALATGAHAEQKFLDGAYGNKDGCAYAKSGESSGSDDFFLLTDEGVTTAVSYCAFTGAMAKTPKGFAGKVSCEEEGGNGGSEETVELLSESGAYTVAFADGTLWGPIAKCR
ncbi:hypothetical protein [Pararhizobium sp.]|uniref:hypothetical protein n=1 Tax=Pararhizobium sp. TaxID=1977563 RepID=UPI0027258125|nr:hypothetical protein [Pararhizobium sp.]MDO9414996.1 hypothetical protein [Pararhizobium sp.]